MEENRDKRQMFISGFDIAPITRQASIEFEVEKDKQKSIKDSKRYYIHSQLKKKGFDVMARERFVIKRTRELSSIEDKYIRELIDMGYCVTDKMFEE